MKIWLILTIISIVVIIAGVINEKVKSNRNNVKADYDNNPIICIGAAGSIIYGMFFVMCVLC